MRVFFRSLTCAALGMALAGCGLIYHPPLQQGSLLSPQAVAQLKPGMTKAQVVALLGTPSIASPFDHNRWDYVHESSARGGKPKVRKFTLFFNNDTLVRTEGKLFSADTKAMLKQANMYQRAAGSDVNGS